MCPYCKGETRYHETVARKVRGKGGAEYYISIERRMCLNCGRTYRKESETVLPYKHYEKKIIFGVMKGSISVDTQGYEEYPSEITMYRWRKSQIMQLLL